MVYVNDCIAFRASASTVDSTDYACSRRATRAAEKHPLATWRPSPKLGPLTRIRGYEQQHSAQIRDRRFRPAARDALSLRHRPRAFADAEDFPCTVHVTEISADAQLHYHQRLTETYYFLECDPDARMQLDDQIVPVRPGISILIRPGTRHRALGRMKVLIIVAPKFDPEDEWFD